MTTPHLHWCCTVFAAMFGSAMTFPSTAAIGQPHDTGGKCIPANERAGRELGCFIMASQDLDRQVGPLFWHLDTYKSRVDAETAKGPRGTVVQSLGKIWLFTITEAEWRPPTGEHVATIGPLPVNSDTAYTALYMEAVFQPGMKSAVHRHSGPEAWYTLAGETCLETPAGTIIGRAGGQYVIVPGGVPMELTASGTDLRRAEVLILHDTSKPPSSLAPDWKPKGQCQK